MLTKGPTVGDHLFWLNFWGICHNVGFNFMSDCIINYKKLSEELAERFLRDGRVNSYLKGHAAAADECIRKLAQAEGLDETMAIVALGGYGRRELFPHSDLDVMVLLESQPDKENGEKIERFLMRLWDMGKTVGSSVRTVDSALEESAKDITVQTALLESRLISGNPLLFAQLQKDFFNQMDPAVFYRAKALELQQRHQKYEDTPFSLEPNVKESPGGLRDLHVLFWCSHAAGMGSTPEEMLAARTISPSEADKLKEAHHALKTFRIYLHLIANRHEDRLIFDLQTRVAEAAGYKDTEHQLASEALMKRYYLTAKSVSQLSDIFMQMFEDRFFSENRMHETVIDRTFIARGYTLDITHKGAFKDDPNAILRAFYLLESSSPLKRFSVSLLRELMSARELIDDQFRNDRANKGMFMQIIKMPHGVSHALLDLNQWGILGLFLPEFQHIVGQMQHDLFHTYTVDQHTMRVVRNIRYFTRSEYAHEYPICTRIMQTMKDNWRLVLAALFHDIGKGLGGEHEKIGSQIVRKFCERFDIDTETTELLVFLVKEHLTMSLVAQKQDISDPDVIRYFADIVQTEEKLNALFLLTVCDIRATGPKVWTQWKSQLLQDLYWQTLPLVRQGGAPDRESLLLQRQKDARKLILEAGVPAQTIESIWKTLTLQYYLRHTAESIAWQTVSLAKVFPTGGPFVATRVLAQQAGIEILVYTPDRSGLFASILGFLQKKRFSVLDARIYTTLDHKAFNTFVVSDNGSRDIKELAESLVPELTEWLINPKELTRVKPGKLSRRSRHFPLQPIVNIEADESGRNYLLSVTCTDRIGLLFDIATILNKYHINLQTAKIMTMGERVEDVFLIDGEALKDIDTTVAIEKDLLEVLTPNV